MRATSGSLIAKVAAIARTQHGVVTAADLIAAGLSRSTIDRWCHKGLLHREYHGVYRLGHRAPSVQAHYLAAVLAHGDGAALGGFAAAHLLRLVKGRPPAPEVVTTRNRRVRGVITHRVRHLDSSETQTLDRIRVTTPARTIIDLARIVPLDDLATICHEAQVLHHVRATDVDAILRRRPSTPGAAELRAIWHGDAPVLLSRLEKRFRVVLRADRLPLPRTNRKEGAHYVDCRWPGVRLTVELDSFRWHSSRRPWEEDRLRERAARARGDEFRRYTWRDVVEDPSPMLAELRALLPPLGCPATAR